MSKKFLMNVGFVSLLALAACSTSPDIRGGHFWEQTDATEAIYKQGPDAQKLLDRNIAECVVDMRELESLKTVKDAIPAGGDSETLDADKRQLADWDTPEHDGALLAEHTDYQDFDGCMKAKGWQRSKYIPYETADTARHNYFLARVDYGYDPKEGKPESMKTPDSFSHLNN